MNLTSQPYGAKVALLAQRVDANNPADVLLGPYRESQRLVAEAAQLAGRPSGHPRAGAPCDPCALMRNEAVTEPKLLKDQNMFEANT